MGTYVITHAPEGGLPGVFPGQTPHIPHAPCVEPDARQQYQWLSCLGPLLLEQGR